VGLAAPQVGVNVRLMVFNPTGRRGDEEITLVNPRVISAGRQRVLGDEGCLSFPHIFAPVEVRPGARRLSAQDR
jgi:peptide deformylase